MSPNARDEARRAERVQHATHAESRRRLQHVCSPVWAYQNCSNATHTTMAITSQRKNPDRIRTVSALVSAFLRRKASKPTISQYPAMALPQIDRKSVV